jgi:hypothetical protein
MHTGTLRGPLQPPQHSARSPQPASLPQSSSRPVPMVIRPQQQQQSTTAHSPKRLLLQVEAPASAPHTRSAFLPRPVVDTETPSWSWDTASHAAGAVAPPATMHEFPALAHEDGHVPSGHSVSGRPSAHPAPGFSDMLRSSLEQMLDGAALDIPLSADAGFGVTEESADDLVKAALEVPEPPRGDADVASSVLIGAAPVVCKAEVGLDELMFTTGRVGATMPGTHDTNVFLRDWPSHSDEVTSQNATQTVAEAVSVRSAPELVAIVDVAPDWAFDDSPSKILVVADDWDHVFLDARARGMSAFNDGGLLTQPSVACSFGAEVVIGERISASTLRFTTPQHSSGRVPGVVMYCGQAVSHPFPFEFRSRPLCAREEWLVLRRERFQADLVMLMRSIHAQLQLRNSDEGPASAPWNPEQDGAGLDGALGAEMSGADMHCAARLRALFEASRTCMESVPGLSDGDCAGSDAGAMVEDGGGAESASSGIESAGQAEEDDGAQWSDAVSNVDDMSVLHLLSALGFAKCLELVCEDIVNSRVWHPMLGATLNPIASDLRNCTPLHWACAGGHELVVHKLLLMDPRALHMTDLWGRSAMDVARAHGHLRVLDLLERWAQAEYEYDVEVSELATRWLSRACARSRWTRRCRLCDDAGNTGICEMM